MIVGTLDQEPAVLESDHPNFGTVRRPGLWGVFHGRQSPCFASAQPRRIHDGRPAWFDVLNQRIEFAGRDAGRQGGGRIALREHAIRRESAETKRNQHPP